MQQSFKSLMLEAPFGHMDQPLRELIETKWDDDPSALQLLEALDHIAFCASATPFVQGAIKVLMEIKLEQDKVSYADLIKQAGWR